MGNDASRPFAAGLKDPAEGPLRPLALKLSDQDHARLKEVAARLRCYPSSLARTMIVRELDQLDATTTEVA